MKVIFLDIDGVLNSTTDFIEAQRREDCINSGGEVISGGKLCLLEEIIEQTDAKIVLSSSWRELFSLKEIHEMFVVRGFTLPITVFAGKTECGYRSMDGTRELYGRSRLIQEWLDAKDNIESYVIIDDMSEERFIELHEGHIVTTDMDNGLNLPAMSKAIDILGRNEEYQKKYDAYRISLDTLVNTVV